MPNTIAQNKFAVHCGVSRQGVAWAIQNKLIAVYKKKINIDHRTTCEYYLKKTGKQLDPAELMKKVKRKSKAAKVALKPKTAPIKVGPAIQTPAPPEPITAPIDDTPPPADTEPDDGYRLPQGIENFEDITIHNLHLIPQDLIKKIKEFEVAAKAKQAREISRGELIKREVVYKFISRLYAIDVSQVKTQEDRLIPELCGIFKVDDGGEEAIKARKLIKNDSADMLESIKRDMDDFIKSLEEPN